MKYSFWGLAMLCLTLSFSSCDHQDLLAAEPCRECPEEIAASQEFAKYMTAVDNMLTTVALNQVDMQSVEKMLAENPRGGADEAGTEAQLKNIQGGSRLFGQMKEIREARIGLQANYDYFSLGKEKQEEVNRLYTNRHPERSPAALSQRILLNREQ